MSETTGTRPSGNGAVMGSVITLLAVSVLLQAVILVLAVIQLNRGAPEPQPTNPEPTASGRPAATPSPATTESEPKVATPGDLRIRAAVDLPRTLPEAVRDLSWHQAADELFALQSTGVSVGGSLPGMAMFHVYGRGEVDVTEGDALFPGSRVRLTRVMDGRAVVATSEDSRELGVPFQSGTRVNLTRDPYASDSGRSVIGGNENMTVERPQDPRGSMEELARQLEASAASKGAAVSPSPAAGTSGPGKPIVEAYPAAQWVDFVKEVRDSLVNDVILKESIDEKYMPNGVELSRIMQGMTYLTPTLRLQEGDRVVSVDGASVRTCGEFEQIVKSASFERVIRFGVVRNGETIEVRVEKFPQQ